MSSTDPLRDLDVVFDMSFASRGAMNNTNRMGDDRHTCVRQPDMARGGCDYPSTVLLAVQSSRKDWTHDITSGGIPYSWRRLTSRFSRMASKAP